VCSDTSWVNIILSIRAWRCLAHLGRVSQFGIRSLRFPVGLEGQGRRLVPPLSALFGCIVIIKRSSCSTGRHQPRGDGWEPGPKA